MCLWMWLYYAFTASVVLFLGCVGDAERQGDGDGDGGREGGVVLDLALLDELAGLCEVLGGRSEGGGGGGGSEGARRVKEIVEGMGRVAWEVVKRRARSRKRGGEGEGGVEAESERRKRLRSGTEGGVELEKESLAESNAGSGGRDIGEGAGAEGVLDLNLETVPQNFEWEQWDQWLQDAPFDLE